MKPHPDILPGDSELLKMGEINHERYTARFMDMSNVTKHDKDVLSKSHPQKELMVMTLLSSLSSSTEWELPVGSSLPLTQPDNATNSTSQSPVFGSQVLTQKQYAYAPMDDIISISLHQNPSNAKRTNSDTDNASGDAAAKKSK